ncbi:BRCA1-associated protein 2-domain-containing protein [Protomyces lactucae-debilis]|uniref:BRCA1-associated protein 2-domain-containing protein n=1 Tax=Protomyces lactucae-debilis TaxID=2754530 RepID=A0A1Y2F1C3_PROLT|nr:BRCA1-associated protein 2-domain-containing protein [Protomyces lactucae-debilis]ORY77294.1 BRCA1-associated protein 2-domain-containing protein [Protomyces lactucae-debilis]
MHTSQYSIVFHLRQHLEAQPYSIFDSDSLCQLGLGNQSHQVSQELNKSDTWYDYRFGQITVESIDMSYCKGEFVKTGAANSQLGGGVVHLFKEDDEDNKRKVARLKHLCLETQGTVVAVLAVPSYMHSSDFVGFIGPEQQKEVSHIRLIRTKEPNRYMVLLKFREASKAKQFLNLFNGRSFNSMDPETVHAVNVASISFKGSLESADSFPELLDQVPDAQKHSTGKPLPPATGSLLELPTCVVCLERMDATVTGLLTMLCEHTFHCSCISKWVDTQSTCPICRFSAAKDMIDGAEAERSCSMCLSDKNLWMCLICGNVACGRYDEQHAIQHFESTRHSFAMDITSGRIWDYASDVYVHRLVQEKMDAKPPSNKQSLWEKDAMYDEGREFEDLLATQLESQRIYYDEQLRSAADRASKAIRAEKEKDACINELQSSMREVKQMLGQLQQETTEQRRLITRAEGKAKTFSELARKMETQYKEEKSINANLMVRIGHLEQQRQEARALNKHQEAELRDLQEQLRDLMFHMSSMEKLQEMPEEELKEVQEGSLAIGASAVTKDKPKRAKKKANKSSRPVAGNDDEQ